MPARVLECRHTHHKGLVKPDIYNNPAVPENLKELKVVVLPWPYLIY